MLKSEIKGYLELKKIAKNSPFKITLVKGSKGARVRFKGAGRNVNRQITDNVNVAPKTQLKAMIRVYKRKNKLREKRK